MSQPVVLRMLGLGAQVCVPAHWTDAAIIAFVEMRYPCGTEKGWQLAKEGDPALAGDHARVSCAHDASAVHVVVVA